MTRRRSLWIILTLVQLAARLCAAQESKVILHFPRDNGVVYGRPHVLIIFDVVGTFQSLVLKLDGRPIPPSVFTFCKICAGNHTAILTSDVPWGAVDGRHVLTVEAEATGGKEIAMARTYVVDSSRPSLIGLSGHVLLPDAFAADDRSVIFGGTLGDRRPRELGFAGAAIRGPVSLEAVGEAGAGGWLSWKAPVVLSPSWALAGGESLGHPFGVLSYRTEPAKLEISAGTGSGSMPRAWLGASYVFTDLTRKSPSKGTLADLLAVSELVALVGEVDDRGRMDIGATLMHPYGWSAGLYRVNIGSPGGWRFSLTYRFHVR